MGRTLAQGLGGGVCVRDSTTIGLWWEMGTQGHLWAYRIRGQSLFKGCP